MIFFIDLETAVLLIPNSKELKSEYLCLRARAYLGEGPGRRKTGFKTHVKRLDLSCNECYIKLKTEIFFSVVSVSGCYSGCYNECDRNLEKYLFSAIVAYKTVIVSLACVWDAFVDERPKAYVGLDGANS